MIFNFEAAKLIIYRTFGMPLFGTDFITFGFELLKQKRCMSRTYILILKLYRFFHDI